MRVEGFVVHARAAPAREVLNEAVAWNAHGKDAKEHHQDERAICRKLVAETTICESAGVDLIPLRLLLRSFDNRCKLSAIAKPVFIVSHH